jgi:hypothetical protein
VLGELSGRSSWKWVPSYGLSSPRHICKAILTNSSSRSNRSASDGNGIPSPKASKSLPSVQRLVDRLGDLPVAVYDPAWTIITWNATWAALMGDPSSRSGLDRNLLWRTFTGRSTRVRKSDDEADDFEINAVADLRRAVGTYPDDAKLSQLVEELRQINPRFAKLWAERMVNTTGSNIKTIVYPEVGPITLACDVLTVAGSDLRVVVYTAEPSSPDAERLRLVQVLGLQRITSLQAE